MTQQRLESKGEEILGKLRKAGASGLTKGGLGIKDAKSIGSRSLRALERQRLVANLGTPRKTRYVLHEFYKPLELACDRIESNAKKAGSSRPGILTLLSRKDLEKGCEGEIRKKIGEAMDWLVKERKILRFRRGAVNYYVHLKHVKDIFGEKETSWIETTEPPVAPQVFGRTEVLNVYRRVKERLGYSNVEIYELQQALGVTMDQMKAFLLEENRRGTAVLSLGDWSLSSEEIRSGAIELFGKPHLLVKFRDEA
jgi:hypothetical protein